MLNQSGLGAHAVIENPIYCGRMTMTMLALMHCPKCNTRIVKLKFTKKQLNLLSNQKNLLQLYDFAFVAGPVLGSTQAFLDLLSRSLHGRHVFTTFLGPVLGVMKASLLARGAPRLEACPRPDLGCKTSVEVPLCGHVSCQFLNLISGAMMKQFLVARNPSIIKCPEQQVTSNSTNTKQLSNATPKSRPQT